MRHAASLIAVCCVLSACTTPGPAGPASAVLPGPDAGDAPGGAAGSADGLTPEQQAEIDAAVAAYREVNRERSAAPPSPPAASRETRRVDWMDPGGTGAGGEPAPPAAPAEEASPPSPPLPLPEDEPEVLASPTPKPRPDAPIPSVPSVPSVASVPPTPPADPDTGPGFVEIAALELCRSVGGFGVYEPFADTTFTAGAPVRMVLYAEIEGYATDRAPAPGGGDDLHRVRLSQEVLLYRDADGLLVWSREPEAIEDESRRRRRDFWSVQLVELPANLGVGRYRLKVRLTDEVSGTVDERSVPLRLVADAAGG